MHGIFELDIIAAKHLFYFFRKLNCKCWVEASCDDPNNACVAAGGTCARKKPSKDYVRDPKIKWCNK